MENDTSNNLVRYFSDDELNTFVCLKAIAFQPVYYNESNPAGQFFGVLFYEYPYKIDLKKQKNVVVKLPNVTDELFEQYCLFGEYINVMPHGIKWRGEFFEKQ